MPQECIACIAHWMRTHGHQDEALLVELCFDCYLRTGEAFALRQADVVLAHGGRAATLRVGVAERGEASKTGMRQGVIVDAPWLVDALADRLSEKSRRASGPLLHTTPPKFRQTWRDALEALGLEHAPPHTLRHSGPSEDLASGYRTFQQVQRRGRWTSEKSVMRYAKTHTLCEAAARAPEALMIRGKAIIDAREQRATTAKE